MMLRKEALISVVVPVFNEELALPAFTARLLPVLRDGACNYEIIFVDDGSQDGTPRVLDHLASAHAEIKIVSFARNFGHQAALLAGLSAARGQCVISLDGDLQHPPELIPQLISHWRAGAKIVATRRIDAVQTGFAKRVTSRLYYRLFSWLSGLPIEQGVADFRLLDRVVVDTLLQLKERTLFLRGLLTWLGYPQAVVEYQAEPRVAGRSKYSPRKMLSLAINGITAFSITPLRIAMVMGFIFSLVSFIYLSYAIAVYFFTDGAVAGWTSIVGSVLFLGGIQLLCLGIIGEYVGKVYQEVKRRPFYVLKDSKGLENEAWNAADAGRAAVGRRAAAD